MHSCVAGEPFDEACIRAGFLAKRASAHRYSDRPCADSILGGLQRLLGSVVAIRRERDRRAFRWQDCALAGFRGRQQHVVGVMRRRCASRRGIAEGAGPSSICARHGPPLNACEFALHSAAPCRYGPQRVRGNRYRNCPHGSAKSRRQDRRVQSRERTAGAGSAHVMHDLVIAALDESRFRSPQPGRIPVAARAGRRKVTACCSSMGRYIGTAVLVRLLEKVCART